MGERPVSGRSSGQWQSRRRGRRTGPIEEPSARRDGTPAKKDEGSPSGYLSPPLEKASLAASTRRPSDRGANRNAMMWRPRGSSTPRKRRLVFRIGVG